MGEEPTGVKPRSISALIDAESIGLPLKLLYAALTLLVMFDGFDAQVIGFVAPAIVDEWGARPAALAPVFAAGLLGMAIGALAVSPLADRFGRRPVLVVAGASFGLTVLITAFVQSIDQLLIIRFVTGFALGGVFPNALSLTSEFTPSRHRTKAVMLMAGSFTFGAAVGGACATVMIPLAGWRGLFLIGGLAPLLIAAVLPLFVPESIKFLAMKRDDARIQAVLRRIFPGSSQPEGAGFEFEADREVALPIVHLFRDGRA